MSSVFPVLTGQRCIGDSETAIDSEPGITKRELFAAMAMQGALTGVMSSPDVLAALKKVLTRKDVDEYSYIAAEAVEYADALIAALSKEPKP